MESDLVTDSVTNAWQHTRALLFARFDAGRWLKFALIALLGSSATRGGMNFTFQPPGSFGQEDKPGAVGPQVLEGVREGLTWLTQNAGALFLLGAGLALISLILFLVILYVRSVFRFIFVDVVASAEEPSIRRSWDYHTGRGLSLLLWHLAIGLVGLLLMGSALIPLALGIAAFFTGRAGPIVLGIGTLVGTVFLVFVIVALLALIQELTNDFLVPVMYVRRCGVWEGWRHVGRAWSGQFWNVVLFYVIKLALGIGAAIVGGIVVGLSLLLLIVPGVSFGAIVAAIVAAMAQSKWALLYLGVPAAFAALTGGLLYRYLVQCLLLPIAVFFQAYALSFVGKLDDALRTI